MEHLYPLLRSVFIFFFLVILIQILKQKGFFSNTDVSVFGRLITELILPVTIFSTLSVGKINPGLLYAAGIYLSASLLTCALAYIACRACRFSDGVTGAIVILAGFGSTATIAYPLILQTYGSNSEAMTTALIIGEFGSCIPFYTIGILILAYFGGRSAGREIHYLSVIRDFMKTPVFFSIAGGLLVSMIPPLSDLMATTFFSHLFSYFLNGFEMIVAITIGLMLRPISIRSILQYIAIAVPLAVIVMPLIVYLGSGIVGVPQIIKEILVIEASVPSGAVAAVMAERYGCDGSTASVLVIVSFLASFLTLPLLSYLLL